MGQFNSLRHESLELSLLEKKSEDVHLVWRREKVEGEVLRVAGTTQIPQR